jgi:hypothetical protein
VSSVSVSGSGAGSKRALAAVLGVLGAIAVIVGILYFTVKGLPSFLTAGSHLHGKKTTHDLRGAVAIVVGVALFVGAWWTSKKK